MSMKKPPAQKAIPSTPEFDFIFGMYRLSKWQVPYFSMTMSLRDAAASLCLVNEFPGAENLHWKLDELYQRDLDWARVDREILPYLRSQEEPQFFNSLTVALLPVSENEMRQTFAENSWAPPKLEGDHFDKVLPIGPVTIGYYNDWTDIADPGARIGRLRWNTSQVFCVAIDGQHRLAALKRLAEGQAYAKALDDTHVPIIALILDPALGYVCPTSASLVDVMRTLFIALNKHARKVSRARQILLDDKSPHSICVRALVGNEIKVGDTDLQAHEPRLPLSLVDWHTENAKFDDGPYITTILGLDWIVSVLTGSKPDVAMTDYRGVRRQIQAFAQNLGIDLKGALDRVKDLEEHRLQPFSYVEGELSRIVMGFRTEWAEPLITLFTQFQPYCNLVGLRAKKDSLTPEFVNWYYLYEKKVKSKAGGKANDDYSTLVDRLASRKEHPIGETSLLSSLQTVEGFKKDNLAFNVVFQRALVLALLEYVKIGQAVADQLAGEEEEFDNVLEDGVEPADEGQQPAEVSKGANKASRTKEFVEAMNQVVEREPDVLRVLCAFEASGKKQLFWMGTLLQADNQIDFTQGAAVRAADLLFWVPAVALCLDKDDAVGEGGFDAFWKNIEQSEKAVHKRIRRSVDRYTRDGGAAHRILLARGSDGDLDKTGARKEAKARMGWLFQALAKKKKKKK